MAYIIKTLICLTIFFFQINYVYGEKITSTFQVKVRVGNSCNIDATNLNFGYYSMEDLNASSTISITCTTNASVAVGLDAGNGNGANTITRRMSYAGNFLEYKLYQDKTRTINWGNNAPNDTLNTTGTGALQKFTVYGQVPGGQTAPIGIYTDTIVTTITFF